MSLVNKIKKIYPDLTDNDFSPEGTIVLQNDSDGKGDYIREWKHPSLSKPTDERLADA